VDDHVIPQNSGIVSSLRGGMRVFVDAVGEFQVGPGVTLHPVSVDVRSTKRSVNDETHP
jgi:hypothetical protein